jgi:hypothetical protein
VHDAIGCERDEAMHYVLELSNIAGPVVFSEAGESIAVHVNTPSVHRRKAIEEMLDEHDDVASSITQRRHYNRDDVDSVVQGLLKSAGAHQGSEVLARRDHQPDVGTDGLVASEPLQLVRLEEPQELGLQTVGELADLVEEHGPTVAVLN